MLKNKGKMSLQRGLIERDGLEKQTISIYWLFHGLEVLNFDLKKYTYDALSMSSVNELISKISAVEKKLKELGVFIPPPAVEYDEYFRQRDKLTGNTKSVKKKLKNAQRFAS